MYAVQTERLGHSHHVTWPVTNLIGTSWCALSLLRYVTAGACRDAQCQEMDHTVPQQASTRSSVIVLIRVNLFFYSSRASEEELYIRTMYRPILRTDDRPTISNGHISATGHPIQFVLDSRVKV